MTQSQFVATTVGAIAVALILDLVRRRQLREKYAAVWIAVGLGIAVLAVFPSLLSWLAGQLGIAVPANLLFFVALLVLLSLVVQLSFELSRIEEHVRTLAEEVAILRLRGELGHGLGQRPPSRLDPNSGPARPRP